MNVKREMRMEREQTNNGGQKNSFKRKNLLICVDVDFKCLCIAYNAQCRRFGLIYVPNSSINWNECVALK